MEYAVTEGRAVVHIIPEPGVVSSLCGRMKRKATHRQLYLFKMEEVGQFCRVCRNKFLKQEAKNVN